MWRHAMRLPALVLVVAAATVACGQAGPAAPTAADPTPAGRPSPLAVAEVYRRAAQTLDRPGLLYHATVQVDADLGIIAYTGATAQWADGRRGVARQENVVRRVLRREADHPIRPGDTELTLQTEQARYTRTPHGEVVALNVWTCHGATAVAAVVLGCPRWAESTTTVQEGQYAGVAAVVLVSSGTAGGDLRETGTSRLYLDAGTFLPLALERDGEVDFGRVAPVRERWVYAHEFIPTDTVPADFFDPAGLTPRPEAFLDLQGTDPPDFTVHWLGARFAGGADLPPLVLARAEAPPEWRSPGLQFLLSYARADAPSGPPVATLQQWPRHSWETFLQKTKGTQLWDDPCVTRRELTLPDGHATLFLGFAPDVAPRLPDKAPGAPPGAGPCPTGLATSVVAHVYLGQTVVVAYPAGAAAGPYGTPEALEALLRALRPRQP